MTFNTRMVGALASLGMEASVPLDRDAVRRVLRRATTLDDGDALVLADVDDRIDADTLVAAAAEVGIPEEAVRRALTVEQLGAPPSQHGARARPGRRRRRRGAPR